jgi:hypothetical protein
MTLVANFVPNPFGAGAGKYIGLFSNGGSHGVLRLSLSETGAFTGRLKLGRTLAVFSGRFSAAGDSQVIATGSDGQAYTATLHYDSVTTQVTGTLAAPDWSVPLELGRLLAAADGDSRFAGRYNLVIPSSASLPAPLGDGIASLTVAANGVVTGSGILADGTAFAVNGPLTNRGEVPIYVSLYGGGGVLTGSLTFRTTSVSDLDGTLYWSRPASSAAMAFSSGFAVTAQGIGSRYVPPALGQPVLPVAQTSNNAVLVLGCGGIAGPVSQSATLNADNSVVITAPALERLALRVNAKSGRFVGQFAHPQTGATTRFRGVILQKQQAGFGFFAGSSGGGYTTFAPAGTVARLAAP